MERQKDLNKYSGYFLYVIFGVGIVGHIIPLTYQFIKSLTPVTLLITSAVVIFSIIKTDSVKVLYWCAAAYIATFFIEMIGVKTGIIFGSYNYGATLGVKLFDVPLIIGLNWVLVVLGAIGTAYRVTNKAKYIPILTAVFAVLFDLILEPVAVKFDYWQWNEGSIPLQNYIAWFIISYLLAYVFTKLKVELKSEVVRVYLYVQTIFFFAMLIFI